MSDNVAEGRFVGPSHVPAWTLGDRMRRALRYADLEVGEIAQLLGSSPATVGRWLNDRGPVKRASLLAWAMATGVSLEWLETGQAPTQPPEPGGSVRHVGLEPTTRCFGVMPVRLRAG